MEIPYDSTEDTPGVYTFKRHLKGQEDIALYTRSPHELRIYLGRALQSVPPTQQCVIDYASAQLRTMVNVPRVYPERTHACKRTCCVSITLGRSLCACQQ